MKNNEPALKPKAVVVDAPKVSLAEGEEAGELLLHFYRALGWNENDTLNPCKIRVTKEIHDDLHKQMYERFPDTIRVGMFLMNSGPGVDYDLPPGKVCLLEDWSIPAPTEGEIADAA
jgi:hypothetical protein